MRRVSYVNNQKKITCLIPSLPSHLDQRDSVQCTDQQAKLISVIQIGPSVKCQR